MLINIIDRRCRPQEWRRVRATVEPATPEDRGLHEQAEAPIFFTPQVRETSMQAAVAWAARLPFGVDLVVDDVEGESD